MMHPNPGQLYSVNVISIPSNSDVYRAPVSKKHDFTVLSDGYAIRWKDSETELVLQINSLFMVMCINKVTDLPIYSYKNKPWWLECCVVNGTKEYQIARKGWQN